ncbi:MAG TPA: hypothetical protein VGB97_03360 [Candidatus Paceibacterota bacterium]|jgi:hypothetical protein
MNWYFASRVRHQPKLLQVAEFLKATGHTFSADWVYQDSLKPYEENLNRVQALATQVVESVLTTDVFVLISDPGGTDMFVELGVMLARSEAANSVRIYIIGGHSKRSLMQLHPSINHAKDLSEVFVREGIDYQNFDIPEFS